MQNLCLNVRTTDQSVVAISYWLYFGDVQVYLEEAVSSFPCLGWHFRRSYFVSSSAGSV